MSPHHKRNPLGSLNQDLQKEGETRSINHSERKRTICKFDKTTKLKV